MLKEHVPFLLKTFYHFDLNVYSVIKLETTLTSSSSHSDNPSSRTTILFLKEGSH